MSVDVSQVPSDCEELVEESFRFSDDFLEKKTPRQRMSKPPHSPKSPYLTSLNMNPRRAAVAAWRLPRASLGGSREGTPGDRETGPGRSAFLSNGHDVSPIIRAECNVSPELLIKNFRKQQRLLHSAPSGFSSSDFRDKEDMYEEIIRLKKTLHAHKSDNRQTRAKVRRLEEENTKREKQIEELLDPTKGAEFTRSLVDKKRDGSVVVNGLKQRILKLEQQCREKENALSRLQSELRTTRLEELKITAQTYFEEIQRLKMLLEAAERSCRAESKCSQRQQRALNSSVLRLTERVSQLQQENSTLREELSTEYPPGGLTGYRDWSKQRLLRRLLELERRPEDKKRPAHPEKSRTLLDQEAQTWPFTMATEAGIAVATMTEGGEEESALKVRLGQWEDERAELQERLRRREEELERAKSEGEKREKEREEWKTGQTRERDEERQRHKEETEALWTKLQTLEEERERAALSGPLSAPLSGPLSLSHGAGEQLDDRGGPRGDGHSTEARRKERAARAIQRGWRAHRDRDVVLLQSVLRGHLHRRSHLEEAELSNGLLDLNSLLLIQAALRGHLTRSGPSPHSWTLPERSGLEHSLTTAGRHASSRPPEGAGLDTADTKPRADADHARTDPSAQATHSDSDDSDNIIVSPSRPIRRREVVTA
ncbi:IQ domain-containing protein E [Eucyclogobius newberryi]|uniref:IQ domain-containing protein E n=1 Tax=Eucyclogobius newberryi TaxID=166745 RepID=UPI003B5B6BEB